MLRKFLTSALCFGIVMFSLHHVVRPSVKGVKRGAKTAYRVIV